MFVLEVFKYLVVLIHLFQVLFAEDVFEDFVYFNDSTDYCKLQCNSKPHTLCTSKLNYSNCKNYKFRHYNIHTFEVPIPYYLLLGHNGIRDRISGRMQTRKMIFLTWDNTLSAMAENWAKTCQPYRNDECTKFVHNLNVHSMYNNFESGENAYQYVGQNRFCVKAMYFPKNFVEMAIRDWYNQKKLLKRPKKYMIDVDPIAEIKYVYIEGINNFTVLAHPLSHRFGCSISRFDDNYCIFCNYYPFYSWNDNMVFEVGDPKTGCPAVFSFSHPVFRFTCTDKMKDLDSGKAKASLNGILIIISVLGIIEAC